MCADDSIGPVYPLEKVYSRAAEHDQSLNGAVAGWSRRVEPRGGMAGGKSREIYVISYGFYYVFYGRCHRPPLRMTAAGMLSGRSIGSDFCRGLRCARGNTVTHRNYANRFGAQISAISRPGRYPQVQRRDEIRNSASSVAGSPCVQHELVGARRKC